MAAPTGGPVADFCRALGLLVRTCRVSQRKIAEALGRHGTSSVSELLSGRRRRVPERHVVETIVGLCAAEWRRVSKQPPAGMPVDLEWWKSRHAELERTAEATRGRGERPPTPVERPPAPVTPPEVVSLPLTLDATAVAGMSVEEAVRWLTDGRVRTKAIVDRVMTRPQDGRLERQVLSDLLAHFPERVRAARGVARAALIQAARVVLVAAAAAMNHDPTEFGALVYGLTEGGHAAHTPALADRGDGGPDYVPLQIVNDYVRLATPLARSCPEFALGAGLPGVELSGAPTTGLAELGRILSEFANGDGLPAPEGALAPGGALLRSPIAPLDSPGPRLPSLADGYITPRFRLAAASQDARPGIASDKWWDEQPLHDDIERFLAEYLLGLPALLAPLVVLGHPGAGKSLLTKLLTARLPAREFRTLRVELRHTPAETGVQAQLEHALKRRTGREVSWPDWSEEESGPIPVVLLDGFDELLQAGAQKLGQSRQWGYLQEVEEFQKREALQRRPLIVIVTSRTVVADRADIPRTSQVVRLEPFDETEIERWLSVWNTTNAGYFTRNGLRPLTPEVVLPHRDLAAQPLLLLMLALYDAVGNALHLLRDRDITRTELYDQLLREFVRRQVDKDGPLPPAEATTAVHRELHRLSVIALSMFHRGAQSISGEEAHRDLRALGEADDACGLLFGRFFFVHEAQAIVTEERLRSYEFMHATFGEHLAARLVEGALRRLVDQGGSPWDDGELYALLSFAPLTDRAQLVQNLGDMLAAWPANRARSDLVPALLSLFHAASWDPEHRTEVAYAPVRLRRRYREAVYEVNLVLIAVLAVGEVFASELFGDALAPTAEWRRHAVGWQAQLSVGSWATLTSTLTPERCWRPNPTADQEEEPDLRLTTRPAPLVDHALNWSLGVGPPRASRAMSYRLEERLSDTSVPDLIRQTRFVGDRDVEHLLHISYPMLLQLPSALHSFRPEPGMLYHSAAQALINLLTYDVYDSVELPGQYLQCLGYLSTLDRGERSPYLEAVMRQLVHDAPAFSDEALADMIEELRIAYGDDPAAFTGAVYQTLLDFLRHALDRGSPRLAEPLGHVHVILDDNDRLESLLELTRLSHSTHTWRWRGSRRGPAARHFDLVLESLDLPHAATTHPTALIDLLRLAAELGLDDWLTTHTPKILAALPPAAFGLLRPSDLPRLRAALPKGAYAEEFEDVEKAWRACK
ncbi:ATP-binding protein [Streptomyces sp. ISL-22]|uniref:NACHT domain-containing protein n=1 Tax=unclassified Streptomyces TaxID=2593676 RepID=UPI001BE9AC1F|nr:MULTISPECIES: ATP-binding protein [unclassified Streptomyces]MBT2417293.1 ATP-binding protein [Streptomyces sp. ISL-24]MBT2437902.1 ATP-binding protein [Streptomyces sp. ISL-22]